MGQRRNRHCLHITDTAVPTKERHPPAMSWCTTGQNLGQFLVLLAPGLLRISNSSRRSSASRRFSSACTHGGAAIASQMGMLS